MKILHTSDWHIGRTFHGYPTLDALRQVLDALVAVVRDRGVDVVVVAGDVFDSATPAAESFTLLTDALRAIRDAGAAVVITSGNHDSATRLGFMSEFVSESRIHIVTRPDQHDQPVTLADEHGPVHFYGIPYLEPANVRHRYPEATLRTHTQMLGFVMDRVRADLNSRGGRSVVISHAFVVNVANSIPALVEEVPALVDDAPESPAGAAPTTAVPTPGVPTSGVTTTGVPTNTEATDVERDITSGGLDFVPIGVFDGPDYVALGHIHGRSTLTERVRYSGAPLHYSFSEAGKPRGGWLVTMGKSGVDGVEWVDLPIPRQLSVLTGDLDDLVADAADKTATQNWVSAVLTDRVRPMDAMRRLQQRYPYAAKLEYRPSVTSDDTSTSYAQRVTAKSDPEIVAGFLEFVRNGVGPSDYETELIAELLVEQADSERAV